MSAEKGRRLKSVLGKQNRSLPLVAVPLKTRPGLWGESDRRSKLLSVTCLGQQGPEEGWDGPWALCCSPAFDIQVGFTSTDVRPPLSGWPQHWLPLTRNPLTERMVFIYHIIKCLSALSVLEALSWYSLSLSALMCKGRTLSLSGGAGIWGWVLALH